MKIPVTARVKAISAFAMPLLLLAVILLGILPAVVAQALPSIGRQVTTLPATNITQTSATLNADVFLGSYSYADVHFQWGSTSHLPFNTPASQVAMSGPVGISITGLSPNTTYYFRGVASSIIAVYGSTLSFTTAAPPTSTPTPTPAPTQPAITTAFTPRSPSGSVPGGSIGGTLISGLYIDHPQVYAGNPATVTVNVVNSGGTILSHNVSLIVNGVAEGNQTVSLAPGSGGTVKFTVIKHDPGTYYISAGGREAELVVMAVAGPEASSAPSNSNSGMIFIMAGAALLVMLAGLMLASSRRR